ncbi:glycosyltransferase family 2 protein [Brevundimonas sp.]|uniref:glycosyltransferase family 2 protein n=2 Tax=unclassified Brevundimonas TaxID=2622653 RepID=UPI0028982EC6|nr:glycosyltransferase family 2 protein [Brevundimonas sp.]
MTRATVIIPTMRRPESLDRAVRSLFALTDTHAVERLVIVDNDPQATAEATARALALETPFPVTYVHQPQTGIANARNTGLAHASDARFIAFLDDDEIASANWLQALLDVQKRYDADVVFGPIEGKAPDARTSIRPVVEAFFSRNGPDVDTLLARSYGCGNSLMKRHTALNGDTPFQVSANQTGGEDDILFARLEKQGARFAWAAQAWVQEQAPSHRANLAYLLQRAFARGQGPSQTAASHGEIAALIRWMAIGGGQLVVFGLGGIGTGMGLTQTGAGLLIRSAEGLGKLLWFSGLEPKLYGASELKRRS